MKIKFFLILIVFLLVSCSGNQKEPDFFQGREGVNIEFASGSPPREIFFRSGDVNIPFLVDVRVKNKGASVTKGGIFISGYDPSLIDIDEIDENKGFFDSCRYTVTSNGGTVDDILDFDFGTFQGFMQCSRLDLGPLGEAGLGISFGDSGVTIDIRDLNFGNILDNLLNTNFFTRIGFDNTNIRFDTSGDGNSLTVTFDDPAFDPNAGSRGPHFLSLWAPYDFEMNQGTQYILQGDTQFFPGGEEEFVTFNGVVKNVPYGTDETTQPIMVTSCYLYTTFASPIVCIDPDPYSESTKVCRPSTYSGKSGQGAPVAITSVTQRSTGREIIFRIEVQNTGKGQIYNPLHIDACSPYYPAPVTEEDLDLVLLGMIYVGEKRLECYPENDFVRLYDGRGVINCVYDVQSQPLQSKSAYETPLIVELWYGYSETIKKEITIRRLAR